MKRVAVAGIFAVTALILPGYVASAQQNVPTVGNRAGTSGQTESAPKEKAAKSAKGGSDPTFVKSAAEGGLAEVELGKLARQKAASDDVKKFGQRMVDDHSKANDQLKDVASKKDITLPADLNARDQATKRGSTSYRARPSIGPTWRTW